MRITERVFIKSSGLAALALASALPAADPVTSVWILAPPASGQLARVLPEVHRVIVGDVYVEVRSAGLSLSFLGPFQNPLSGGGGLRDLRFRIPRKPALAPAGLDSQRIGPGALGVFRNGVPLYNRFAEASYLGQNIWHFDTVAVHDPERPTTFGLLEDLIARSREHSPILGFALDGFPIYGPWAFANTDGTGRLVRMRSGYRVRNITDRTAWPDGRVLTPGQYGPPVNNAFPLGTFAEDYEFDPAAGHLDSSNGRFTITPDYPQGTYAYFLSTTLDGRPSFPYFLADRFRGVLPAANTRPRATRPGIELRHLPLATGAPVPLTFAFPGTPFLETVHEKPLHVMIVSANLETFDHIHPEPGHGGFYSVSHAFPRPGRYRLFAQFTRPGEHERLETFDLTVTGKPTPPTPAPAPSLKATLAKPQLIHTGQDIEFTVSLAGQPIEPYLGAWGHFVFLDQPLATFIHAHPAGSATTSTDPSKPHIHGVSDAASGPPPTTVTFTANFLKPGRYKLWAQFQVGGVPAVFPFAVDVAGQSPAAAAAETIPPGAIRVAVDSRGFTPSRIEAKPGTPLTLAISRAATPNCGSTILFPALKLERNLAVGKTTVITIPNPPRDLAFTCGMGMYRGLIVVR